MIFLAAPVVCESDQKAVTSQVAPTILAVPGVTQVLRISPADGITLPLIACTSIPEIVRASNLSATPSVENVTVIVEFVTAIEAAVISVSQVPI